MTLDESITALRNAIGGDTSSFAAELADARERSGVPDGEIPAVLALGYAALATGLAPRSPLPAREYVTWLLDDFVDLFPSAYTLDQPGVEGITVPALGRSLLIHGGDAPSWEVVSWPPR